MALAAPLLGTPERRGASPARALLLELTRVHPLLHAGAALHAYTALTAALSGGVLLAMLLAPDAAAKQALELLQRDSEAPPPPPPELRALLMPLITFALNAATALVAAVKMEWHYRRCAVRPRLKRSALLGAVAGLVAAAWAAMLAGDATLSVLARADFAGMLCTVYYSILVRRWLALRCDDVPSRLLARRSCSCGVPYAPWPWRSGSTPATSERRRRTPPKSRRAAPTLPPAAWRAAPTRSSSSRRCR